MFAARIALTIAVVSSFSCSLAFPSTESKDEWGKLVTTLLEEGNVAESQPSESKDEVTKEEWTPDNGQLGHEGNAGDRVAKRVPWSVDFYNNLKRFGGFDSINHYSNFGKFQKRKNGETGIDTIDRENFINRLKRRAFDSIHHYSDFGRFNKRSIPRFGAGASYRSELGMPSWKRRAFDSIHHYSDFGRFSRKK